ncbi:hypothetical protein M4I33_10625 [Clostridium sp. LY3-2]|uniref:hypothetical protein n=1 Tax=Clostridium sp. LY3-2 TaxID=2942482 RepID=UPI002152D650|nr:hypothetical protein [Clostridium sp. LY3-2]MCR6515321.1 hypothetical protein [Clostridium sp. LY3-2]
MKCNCIKDLENRLLEKVKVSDKFQNLEGVSIKSKNMAFMIKKDGTVTTEPYIEFEAKAPYKTKSGSERTKKEVINVTCNYCPFCGEKI